MIAQMRPKSIFNLKLVKIFDTKNAKSVSKYQKPSDIMFYIRGLIKI